MFLTIFRHELYCLNVNVHTVLKIVTPLKYNLEWIDKRVENRLEYVSKELPGRHKFYSE